VKIAIVLFNLGGPDSLEAVQPFLRNHGLLTACKTIPEAFNAMHRLELSCKTQIAAMSCNTPLIEVPTQVVEATYLNYQPHVRRAFGVLDWPALLRKLDRIDPSFRD